MEKYYYLKKGEEIKEGDECEVSNWNSSELEWQKAQHGVDIGTKAPDPQYSCHRMYRRLIEEKTE